MCKRSFTDGRADAPDDDKLLFRYLFVPKGEGDGRVKVHVVRQLRDDEEEN